MQSLGNAPKELNLQTLSEHRDGHSLLCLCQEQSPGGVHTQLTAFQSCSVKIPLQASCHGAIPITESSGTLPAFTLNIGNLSSNISMLQWVQHEPPACTMCRMTADKSEWLLIRNADPALSVPQNVPGWKIPTASGWSDWRYDPGWP